MFFRARVICQMKEEKIRVKMMVVVLLWGRRCGGNSRKKGAAARVDGDEEMRERERDK